MVILIILLATWVATSLMTAFSYMVSAAFKELYKEPVLLQYLMTRFNIKLSNAVKAVAGWIIHYMIGLIFVIAYYVLWRLGVYELTWISGLLYGCMIGIIGIGGWVIMFILSNYMPTIDFKGYYLQLFFAHIIFALSTWAIFKLLL